MPEKTPNCRNCVFVRITNKQGEVHCVLPSELKHYSEFYKEDPPKKSCNTLNFTESANEEIQIPGI